MKTITFAAALLALPLVAAPPPIVNGSVQSLTSLRSAPATGWIGYPMATREPLDISPCGCRLDYDYGFSINRHDADDIGPVGESKIALFAHFQDGSVDRVRMFSAVCSIDGSGHTIGWIDSVSQDASIAFLRNAVEHGTQKARGGALTALAFQAGATDTLIDLARNNADRDIRGKALFWLSQEAGRKAADALKDAVNNDPEESVRGKAVFGISQLPNDQSIPLLIDLLKNNRSREVRKKAAFWLGQKNDPRALAAIEEILNR